MTAFGSLLATLLWIFLILLIVRMIVGWVMILSRSFHPTGPMVVVLEVVYTVTDPPLRLLRRFIPPLRIGGVALDLGFLLLFILVQILIGYAYRL